jgi:hypothetical protein
VACSCGEGAAAACGVLTFGLDLVVATRDGLDRAVAAGVKERCGRCVDAARAGAPGRASAASSPSPSSPMVPVRNARSVERSARVSGVIAGRRKLAWEPGRMRAEGGARGGLPNVGGAANGELSHPSSVSHRSSITEPPVNLPKAPYCMAVKLEVSKSSSGVRAHVVVKERGAADLR